MLIHLQTPISITISTLFDSPPNQMYFFLNVFHPFLGGALGIVWRAMTRTGSFSTNISALAATQVFFKTYNQFQQASSKHCIDLMKLLHMTVKQSNVNNNVLSCLPSHDKDIYKPFMGGKHSMQTNLPVPTTFNIANTT